VLEQWVVSGAHRQILQHGRSPGGARDGSVASLDGYAEWSSTETSSSP
jgi:hypothetical protein